MRRLIVEEKNYKESLYIKQIIQVEKCNKKIYVIHTDARVINGFIEAYGSSYLMLFKKSQAFLYNNTVVLGYDYSKTTLYNFTYGKFYDNSEVTGYDNCIIKAYDNTIVKAYGECVVYAYDYSIVEKHDERVKVILKDDSKLIELYKNVV